MLPCQFEISCTKGTIFYRTGIMTMILANNVLIKSSRFEKRHYDSGGVSSIIYSKPWTDNQSSSFNRDLYSATHTLSYSIPTLNSQYLIWYESYRMTKNSSQYRFSGRRQILKNLMLHWMKLQTFKSIMKLFLEIISILIFARFSNFWNTIQNRTMSKVDDNQSRRFQSFHADYLCWTSVTFVFWH